MADLAHPNALIFLDFPCLDLISNNARFDQIHNQHLHYFTLNSLSTLITSCGGSIIDIEFNRHFWSSMLIVFCFGRTVRQAEISKPPSRQQIFNSYLLFKKYSELIREFIDLNNNDTFFGWTASQVFPVLAHHMKLNLNNFITIIDVDTSKRGFKYANLDVSVVNPDSVAYFRDVSVLITAPDNAKSILPGLLAERPKKIIHPLISI